MKKGVCLYGKNKIVDKKLFNEYTNKFLQMLNYYLLVVIMTSYSIENLGASPSKAGLVSGIFVIGALISRLFSGRWMEEIGRRKMLILGTFFCVILTASYFFTNGLLILVLVRFLHGASYGASSTALGTIVTGEISKERRGEGIGYFMLSITLASAVGPFIGMHFLKFGCFSTIFFVCVMASFLSLIFSLIIKVNEIDKTAVVKKINKTSRMSKYLEVKAIPICIICSIIYFNYSSIIAFLSPYSQEINLVEVASVFFIVYSVAILLSRPFTGRMFDIKGENVTMYPAFFAFTIGMFF